jgi:hypothetical protein
MTTTTRPHVPTSPRRTPRLAGALAAAALGATACGVAAVALPVAAHASTRAHTVGHEALALTTTYSFDKLGDAADPTFNQLLGINDEGVIAGYFGSGAKNHPNKGYTISAYAAKGLANENFPGSVQTQVTGLNDMGKTVGFYVTASGANIGFFDKNGVFTSVADPNAAGSPATTQLLGVNNLGMSVGFYNDATGNAHAFEFNTKTGAFTALTPPGAVSAMATGINDLGDVSGIITTATKATEGFLLVDGTYELLNVPGASATQAFGLNDADEVVGQYSSANGKTMHGFLFNGRAYRTIDDPAGIGSTLVNGINNAGDVVGFYTDAAGNTDGFVGMPVYNAIPA